MFSSVYREDLQRISESSVIDFSALKGSTVLITGATGLVGSNLVRTFLYLNAVRGLDMQIVALIRNREKAEQIFGDLRNGSPALRQITDSCLTFEICNLTEASAEEICAGRDVDYIFHTAGITASKLMVTKPAETLDASILGTRTILQLAAKKKCRSVVYLSSMEMYGTCSTDPVTEKDLGYIDPLKVRSNYPESKRLCDNMCIAYLSEYQVPVKIARLAQTFGAGILPTENRVFAQFARSVRKGEDIVLHTKGLSDGNYCYLSDAIEALLVILLKGSNGEAYNVANEAAHTTIADMAKMVCEKISGGKSGVVFDIPEDNVYGYAEDVKMRLSSEKLQSLGWRAKIGLEDAYRRLIRDMDERGL